MTREALTNAALKLPLDDKVELAERLLASIDPTDQKAIDAAWAKEAEARMAQYDAGKIGATPASEVLAELRR